jgi:serine/threonine-protein kinase HipA
MQVNAIVFIEIGGETVPAGQLSLLEDGRFSRCEFAYGRRYLQRPDAVAIDPVQLPLGPDLIDELDRGGEYPPALTDFLAPGTDLGGARPKGTVTIDGLPHLVKFGLDRDRYNNAAVEAGCLDLCEMAGLTAAERRVIRVGDRDALILGRFDREEGERGVQRRHLVSSLTLLGAHESDRGFSGYADLYDATRRHGVAGDHGETIFRRMVMNVLCGNTDDHHRNTAFLLSDHGRYELSPVYDVTPTLQVSTSRNLFFHLGRAGSGREATLENAAAAGPSGRSGS